MFKHLSIFTLVSTVFISGCGSSSDPASTSPGFFGVWETECNNFNSVNRTFTLTLSKDQLIITRHGYENSDCTGNSEDDDPDEYGLSYGDKVTVNSGVEATQITITDADDGELFALELIYRDGNKLYLGDGTETENTWPTDIDYDFELTLQ